MAQNFVLQEQTYTPHTFMYFFSAGYTKNTASKIDKWFLHG